MQKDCFYFSSYTFLHLLFTFDLYSFHQTTLDLTYRFIILANSSNWRILRSISINFCLILISHLSSLKPFLRYFSLPALQLPEHRHDW